MDLALSRLLEALDAVGPEEPTGARVSEMVAWRRLRQAIEDARPGSAFREGKRGVDRTWR